MAALSKTAKIGNRDVTVRELTMKQISVLSGAKYEQPIEEMVDLLHLTTDLKKEDLLDLAPSEVQGLIDAVLEVNSSFLSQAQALGMKQTAEALENLIRSIFTLSFLT